MNTADLCAEGRDYYEAYMHWKYYHWKDWGVPGDIRLERAEMDAYRRYQEHVRTCDQCKKGGE